MKETHNILVDKHVSSKLQRVPQTSVVSPLFAGQFNYCLDEIHLYKKYGNFINLPTDESFNKIQPSIRLADYNRYFVGGESSTHHLAQFHISTIHGGRFIERKAVKHADAIVVLLDFLTKEIGLEKSRLYVNYLGEDMPARDIEASYKTGKSEKRVLTDVIIDADIIGRDTLLAYGLSDEQVMPNNTRDCFLTTNWDITTAPWGYRNEFHYKLPDGTLLDIATIERLEYEPIIEVRDGKNYVVDIKDMETVMIIDGTGIERLTMARLGINSVFELLDFNSIMGETGLNSEQVEGLRILHRVFTDSDWDGLKQRQRKEKVKHIMRTILDVPEENIRKVLQWNTENYKCMFDDLAQSHDNVIAEIAGYKQRVGFC